MRDSAGNLYGTTAQGGEGTNNYYGTVFKIDSSGSLRVLHSFNGADGKHPHSVLIMIYKTGSSSPEQRMVKV